MAFKIADRVKETAAAPGTGAVSLGGAVTGFQAFSAAVGNSNTSYYAIWDGAANWEVGYGTYASSGNTLTRTQILANSAGTTVAINFTGAVTVWGDMPAEAFNQFGQSIFTTTGTFTTPANSTPATVYRYRMVGSGGGGAGDYNLAALNFGAPGGGYGAYAEDTFTGLAPGTAIAVTLGAAGTAGPASATPAGGNGGDVSLGSPISVTVGGGRGGPSSVSGPTLGGLGGTVTAGTPAISYPGQSGYAGALSIGISGFGGSGPFGSGGASIISGPTAGNPGLGYGAGGSGGRGSGASSVTGGVGTKGIVIIERVSG